MKDSDSSKWHLQVSLLVQMIMQIHLNYITLEVAKLSLFSRLYDIFYAFFLATGVAMSLFKYVSCSERTRKERKGTLLVKATRL